ncbi:nicotinate-nucleotide--dimethylbenzimidazole phosphoribosyltransferase [Paenibacillus chitinolyticus]|uniref:Nicotinate-nucleotide--dimethylbenzimidazole phosphoribosyltransferase n=1 Tax=Paenibacillus chitinolyticus TaxID=79263 RepID=A0A410WT50_9BACL|nr:nicotinate-nucleotide--dimethylbenzimidazole phosphoribosyltransferase [Paenibacillus chitinolyticus]MCY9588828.1 nicotinate-nucleotide--dimethylbenzimidazole phosphoribosyltransferase [Paenibacillus chitinolyticus]MCY9595668.1 nicotinate-nucleotide--dimethylbenzimidazole phosphoribosyltransferase [Paenibacillus chitinolyticus]QAV17427.1 nicotinate-nucleotide--dimethylbenzimidazole phosphoribosyltransferase [Paenibacillus chitinolyticus]
MNELQDVIGAIRPLRQEAKDAASVHLDNLTKPPGSLGKLEDMARQLAGITGEVMPDMSRKAIVVMAADHGVCEEGVSAFPQEVTRQMVMNFLQGGAAVNVLARHAGAEVVCVDIGVNADLEHPDLLSRKVRKGTANMAREAAMTREEALQAIRVGIEVADGLAGRGVRVLATGEMGIGNTTASSALLSVLGGIAVEEAVGRGTGIDDARWLHKQEVVRRAIEVNKPDADDALDVLAKVGGLEIAGLTGVILGAAKNACPVVIDGFISSAAALVASRLAPESQPYMIASHQSHEQGHGRMLEAVGLGPMLHMDMRLGEGTGAALCFTLMDAAGKIMREMASFESAGVSRG